MKYKKNWLYLKKINLKAYTNSFKDYLREGIQRKQKKLKKASYIFSKNMIDFGLIIKIILKKL